MTDFNTIYAKIGLTPRLISATAEQIPDGLRRYLKDPSEPLGGMGLSGNIGCGKSSFISVALMARVRYAHARQTEILNDPTANMEARIRARDYLSDLGNINTRKRYMWVYWPDAFNYLQMNATNDAIFKPASEFCITTMKKTNLLILDDIGRDRNRTAGDVSSFATGQLESVINHRNQHKLSTIWISNLDEVGLIKSLGAAVYTRLVEDNLPLPYLDLPNLR